MQLTSLLDSTVCQVSLEATTKEEVLKQIASLATQSEQLKNLSSSTIYSALQDREELGSTGFGNGVAIPHCRIPGVENFVVGLTVSKDGVAYDAADDKPVHLFAFIIAPEKMKNEHVHILAKVSRVLATPNIVEQLVGCKDSATLCEVFLKNSDDDLTKAPEDLQEKVLFHVVVQDEEKCEKIVEVFTALDGCSATVVRADDSSTYFGVVPLFKAFLSEDTSFNRVLIATLPRKLANETVRQIEEITGDLSKNPGVLVTVQDLFYSNGSLNY